MVTIQIFPDLIAEPAWERHPAPRRRRPPNPEIRALVQAYNQRVGLPTITEGHYVHVDEVEHRLIGDAYDALPDTDRDNPDVARAYDAFRAEISVQWAFAINERGIRFDPWPHPEQPYRDSQEMMDDIRYRTHLFFFTGGESHPYLSATDPETGLTANDQFRAVHDLFGHAAEGNGFGARGEENAWIKHSQMFGAAAQLAMTTETRGQNAWTNFGRHNYDAAGQPLNIPPEKKPYAKQKVALLPPVFCDWRRVLRKRSGTTRG